MGTGAISCGMLKIMIPYFPEYCGSIHRLLYHLGNNHREKVPSIFSKTHTSTSLSVLICFWLNPWMLTHRFTGQLCSHEYWVS